MTRGVVTLVFDDGYRAVFERVLPLLTQYGVRAVFAVPVDTAGLAQTAGAPVAPLEHWKRSCNAGAHELAAHGVSHRALTQLTDGELAWELTESKAATNSATLVYPGGAHDDRVVRATRRYFRAARTVIRGFEDISAKARHRLRSFVATRDNYRAWKWNLFVFWAFLTNRWIIETYHDVALEHGAGDGERVNLHTVPLAALNRHLWFLKLLPIRIATIRDMTHP